MFEESGLVFNPNPELGEAARAAGLHPAYHEAVMQAMWDDGRDVADPAVLREIAGAVGLATADVDAALEERAYGAAVDESTHQAHGAGINAVPAFVFDQRYLVLGAQPHAALEQVMATLAEESAGNA
jgi:predicted DsbA family dithiol-disulfide isomerase